MKTPLQAPGLPPAILDRRAFLLSTLTVATVVALPAMAFAEDPDLSIDMLVNDPAAPISGNPKGKLTMVAFLDYNCPWCKKTATPMHDAIARDGDIRLVYKDWPIITEDSAFGARLALAAKYQDKYDVAHEALMAIKTPKSKADDMNKAVRASALDFARLEKDMKDKQAEIDVLLARNYKQAMSLQLSGTPAFIIGKFLVPGAIQSAGEFADLFKQARQQG